MTYLRQHAKKLGIKVVDGPRINFKRNMCKRDCLQCEHLDPDLKANLDEALSIFEEKMDRAFESVSKRKPSKQPQPESKNRPREVTAKTEERPRPTASPSEAVRSESCSSDSTVTVIS